MKTELVTVHEGELTYSALKFSCPGCAEMFSREASLHILPVNTDLKSPSWGWNGVISRPTLEPSILTKTGTGGVCHSYLREGVFEFLPDSTHSYSGQRIEMSDLPDWAVG